MEKDLNVTIAFNSAPLFYNAIEERVEVRTIITYGESFNTSLMRVVYKYKIDGGIEKTYITPDFSVSANSVSNKADPLQFNMRNATNYYDIRCWLEVYNSAISSYIEVAYNTIQANIFVPNPN